MNKQIPFMRNPLLNGYYLLYSLSFLFFAGKCDRAPSKPDDNSKLEQISDRAPLGGPAGIPNLGNTCFMNAALQVVAALYADKITDASPALKKVVTRINQGGLVPRGDMEAFREELRSCKGGLFGQYLDGGQHDAWLFLDHLNKEYPFLDEIEVIDIYQGLNDVTRVPCFTTSSNKFDDKSRFLMKPLPLISANGRYIRDLPDVSMWVMRNEAIEHIHLVARVLPEDFYKPSFSEQQLTLEACTVHLGNSLESGHYISYIKKGSQWYCISDGSVSRVNEDFYKNITTRGLCCFYKKANATPASTKTHQPGQPAGIPKMDDVPHSGLINTTLQVVAACCANEITDPCLKGVIETINKGKDVFSTQAIKQLIADLQFKNPRLTLGSNENLLPSHFLEALDQQCAFLDKIKQRAAEGTGETFSLYTSRNLLSTSVPDSWFKIKELPDLFLLHEPTRNNGIKTCPLILAIDATHFDDKNAQEVNLVACMVKMDNNYCSYIKKGENWYVVANDIVTCFDTLTDGMLQKIYTAADVLYVYKKA